MEQAGAKWTSIGTPESGNEYDLAALPRLSADARVLAGIDGYYADQTGTIEDRAVRTQLVRQLALPEPRASRTIRTLSSYKGLTRRWHDWDAVVEQCNRLAIDIAEVG